MTVRGLATVVALVAAAGAVGIALGLVLTKLGGNDDPAALTAGASRTTEPATTGPRATSASKPVAQDPLSLVRVRVLSAVLHPAATRSGKRRRRARLGVHVEVHNRGAQRVVLQRPSLLAANRRVSTDPRADARGSRLRVIGTGRTADVTLRFETAGALTRHLVTRRRARVLIAKRSLPVSITVGTAVSPRRQSRGGGR